MTARLVRGASIAALLLAIVVVRVLWSSRVEWQAATAAEAAGDLPRAIDGYGRAARLYAPGSPWSTGALTRLAALAAAAEAAGERERALSAWRELRSSVLAIRAVYSPHRDHLAVANQHIATLAAALESPSVDPSRDEPARRRWHADRLARSEEPSVAWSLLALLGLGLWVGAAIGFLFRGLDREDRLRPRPALLSALGVALGLGLFVLGLARA